MPRVVRFDSFEVDLSVGQIRKHGLRIRLRDQPFQVLASLIEKPGEVITREELRQRLWRDAVFVDFDNGLNIAIARLRAALGDSAEHPHFIETLPKRGYRFVGDILDRNPSPPSSRKPRLLVLPFTNLSGDAGQEFFADAMTDEVITALVTLVPRELSVLARTTAMHYKGRQQDLERMARDLNLDYLVEGSLHHCGEPVVVNVQLIDTRRQDHLFAHRYNVPARELFELECTIARDIAAHLCEPAIRSELEDQSRLSHRRKPTENLAAYNAYIQGRFLFERMTFEAFGTARQYFESAIERDPEYALAHVALADLYSWMGYLGYIRPKDAYLVGTTYALRAVELDTSLAEAHAVLAEYHKQVEYDWHATEREMALAMELSRASPFVRLRYAVVFLMPQNRMKEAIAEIERALDSDPLAGSSRFWLAILLLLDRDYDRAIEVAGALAELEPASPWPAYVIGVAYRQKYFEGFVSPGGKLDARTASEYADRAITEHRRAIALSPGSDVLLGWLGLALGMCGRQEEASALLEQLRKCDRYILPTSYGHIYLGLGNFEAALDWFERAVDECDQLMMPILSYAHFDPLRRHPRFSALLKKMNLVRSASSRPKLCAASTSSS